MDYQDRQITDAELAEIAAMQEHESAQLDTGLKEHVIYELQEAYFAVDPNYSKNSGEDTVVLKTRGIDRSDGQEFDMLFSIGKNWRIEDGGSRVVSTAEKPKTSFHVKSSLGMVIDSITREKADLKAKKITSYRYGPACYREILTRDMRRADTWVGHIWELGMIETETINREGGSEVSSTRRKLFPRRYLGKVGGGGSAPVPTNVTPIRPSSGNVHPGHPAAPPPAPPGSSLPPASASGTVAPGAVPAAAPPPPPPPPPPPTPSPSSGSSILGSLALGAEMQQVLVTAAKGSQNNELFVMYVMNNAAYFAQQISNQAFSEVLTNGALYAEIR